MRGIKRRGVKLLLCVIGALLLAGAALAALTVGVSYGWIPGFGVVKGAKALYTNAETRDFGYMGQGRGELKYVVAKDDELTVVLAGSYTDGRAETRTSGGASGETAEGVILKAGEAEYATTSFSGYVRRNTEFGMTYVFPVPTVELSEGMELTLLLPDGSDSVAFTLKAAESIGSLSELGPCQSNKYIDIAVDFETDEETISAQLYSDVHTDLRLVCYGYGGGFGTAVPGKAVCLKADGETLYCLERDSKFYYPSNLRFENTNAEKTTLEIPFVIMKSGESAELHRQFASVEEALQYSELIELENCALRFSVEQLNGGSLTLSCVITGDSEALRAVGLERDDGVLSRTVNVPAKAGELWIRSVLPNNALTDSLTLDYKLSGVYYAVTTDFSFELE